MNTEALNTLKQVREGINAVQIALNDPALDPDEKKVLGKVAINLNRQEDILINNILQAMVDKINACNGELKRLITEMEAASERLARFSDTVKKISDVLGTLAEITAKAMTAGIL